MSESILCYGAGNNKLIIGTTTQKILWHSDANKLTPISNPLN